MLKPLIPPHLTWVALALGGALFAAGQFVPAPYGLVCAGVGSVALYLAGKGWRTPQWAVGKPLLPSALVPLALSAVQVLNAFGGSLPAPLQPYVAPLVGLLSLLAGVVEPEPLKVDAKALPAPVPANPDGTVTVQVAAECSLGGAAQGCKP